MTAASVAINYRTARTPSRGIRRIEISLGRVINRINPARARINRPLKTGARTRAKTRDELKILDNKKGEANLQMDGRRTASSRAVRNRVAGNQAPSRLAVSNQTASSRVVETNLVGTRTEAANKAIDFQAAARQEGAPARSAPNCANGCAKLKTYAETWDGTVIWRTSSTRRFRDCGAPTTRSRAKTWRPLFC